MAFSIISMMDDVRNHALNNDPKNFPKLSIYYDDVEIQNPSCSSQKYKLAMFYFQVLNIAVQFRLKLQTIFLYGICRSKHLTKFGFKNFIKNFTDTVEELQSQGTQMSIQGYQFLVKGTLVYAICNAPSSGILGGIKESAQALRPCRRCHGDKTSIREKFLTSSFKLRDMETHMEQCRTLENNALSKANKKYWSKIHGINNYSPICFISGFPIKSNLIQDSVHNLSEGINYYLLALFLHRCIVEYNFFTLDWLNDEIQSYSYTRNDMGHVPKIITRHK